MLDPQAKALLQLVEQSGLPPIHTLDPVSARRAYREGRGFSQPAAPEMALVRDLDAPGPRGPIPLRLYRPLGSRPEAALPVLVYYHGGGYVIGDRDTHDVLCRQLSNASACAVVSVDYRMAPEHPFPAPSDDCFAATRWVHEQAANLGLDPDRLAVGGDSAGGNLAAVVSIAARDEGGHLPIRFQLLIYPGTDMRRRMESHRSNGQGYLLTQDTIDYFVGHYLSKASDYDDWRASPIDRQDLAGLPPALVLVAGHDPLRDEGIAYAQRLSEAGNRTTLVNFERQIHGFITMGRVIDEANTAVTLCASVVREALGATREGG